MAPNDRDKQIAALREAYAGGNLTLYLGAGVSHDNGIYGWDKLVLAMYFTAISRQSMNGWRPFPNYLFAVAEWHLNRAHEPLDITARRILKYHGPEQFLESLRDTLYAAYATPNGPGFQPLRRAELRNANATLDSVARLCEGSVFGSKGVRAVVTYNYDELLETALGDYPFQSFCKAEPAEPGKLPIYHVHGFVPINEDGGSAPHEIVFTEDKYNLVAHDTYSWTNLVQIQSMSGSAGLMIGLSLSDRNMRRLLDAIVRLPSHPKHYALVQRPKWVHPSVDELDAIQEKAKKYRNDFEKSGVKGPGAGGSAWRDKIQGILEQVEKLDVEQQTFVLNQLGVEPIWYDEHAEIKTVINKILET